LFHLGQIEPPNDDQVGRGLWNRKLLL